MYKGLFPQEVKKKKSITKPHPCKNHKHWCWQSHRQEVSHSLSPFSPASLVIALGFLNWDNPQTRTHTHTQWSHSRMTHTCTHAKVHPQILCSSSGSQELHCIERLVLLRRISISWPISFILKCSYLSA